MGIDILAVGEGVADLAKRQDAIGLAGGAIAIFPRINCRNDSVLRRIIIHHTSLDIACPGVLLRIKKEGPTSPVGPSPLPIDGVFGATLL